MVLNKKYKTVGGRGTEKSKGQLKKALRRDEDQLDNDVEVFSRRQSKYMKEEEEEKGLEDYERFPRGGEAWLLDAQKASALPVRVEGQWQKSRVEASTAEVEIETESVGAKVSRKSRKEKASKGASTCACKIGNCSCPAGGKVKMKTSLAFKSAFMNGQQRMDLRKKYPEFVASSESMMSCIAEINKKVMADTEKELYWLELILFVLGQVASEYEKTKHPQLKEEKRNLFLLIFLSLGCILKNILPAYKMQEGNDATDPTDDETDISKDHPQEKNTDKPSKITPQNLKALSALQRYESHLLSIYHRFLTRHLFSMLQNRNWMCHSRTDLLSAKFIHFVADFSLTARFTNFRESFLEKMVEAILLAQDASQPLVQAFQDILLQDTTLGIAGRIVPFMVKKLTALKNIPKQSKNFAQNNQNLRYDSQSSGSNIQHHQGDKNKNPHTLKSIGDKSVAAILLLRSLEYLDIGNKEAAAQLELQRRGIKDEMDLSRSRDKTEREIDAQLMKEMSTSLVHGDFKKFRQLKAIILTEIITFLARVLKSPHLFPLDLVFECLRTLSHNAVHVNIEILIEILEELRNICEKQMQKGEKAGQLFMGCVVAAVNLIKARPSSFPLLIDLSWIGRATLKGVKEVLPFLTGKNPLLQPEELRDTLLSILDTKKAWGTSLPELSHLTAPPEALEFLTLLLSSFPHLSPSVLDALSPVAQRLIALFPVLKGALDAEGLVFSSLETAKTIIWPIHLLKASSLGPNASRAKNVVAAIQQLCN